MDPCPRDLQHFAQPLLGPDSDGMSWFFRAVEQPEGQWVCRFGPHDLGTYPNLTVALHHLVEIATELGGRHNFTFRLHRLDGTVESRPGTDLVPGE